MPRFDRLAQFDRYAIAGDRSESREAELDERREPFAGERVAKRSEFARDVMDVGSDIVRQQPTVVQRGAQRISLPSYGCCQKRATSVRSRSICTALIRACGGISKARNSNSPSRPVAESGEYSLSIENSERCVLPVRSVNRWRSSRSVNQGSDSAWPLPCLRDNCWNAISSSYNLSSRASSTRGAWLVGPMNVPENRYDSEGWFCQYVTRLRSKSGRRRSGLSAGVAPPS